VVIAMLLLGLGILALMSLQIRSIRSNAFNNSMTVALYYAQNQIETLRATSWGDIADGVFADTVEDTDPDTGVARMVFTRRYAVETDVSGRMKDASVTVSWNQNGRSHQLAVNTKIARRE
jgi:Tfp pilus assembly protein PilV